MKNLFFATCMLPIFLFTNTAVCNDFQDIAESIVDSKSEIEIQYTDKKSKNRILENIKRGEDEPGAEKFWMMLANFNEACRKLIDGLSSNDETVQARSSYLLGRYRYKEAAKPLANYITMQYRKERGPFGKRPWSIFPAYSALIEIGMPSVKPLVANIKGTDNLLKRDLSLLAIKNILSTEFTIALIEQKIEESKNVESKQKLNASLLKMREWLNHEDQGKSINLYLLIEEHEIDIN